MTDGKPIALPQIPQAGAGSAEPWYAGGLRFACTQCGNCCTGGPGFVWLTYADMLRTAGELDWKAIGGTWGCATSMLNAWTPNPDAQIPFPEFNSIVAAIGRGHALLGRYVHRYFEDIKTHLLSLREVLAPQARCRYIVGNSKFYDTILPVEQIYAALFKGAGFANIHIETIRKRTSKKELYEFIVHAQMPA